MCGRMTQQTDTSDVARIFDAEIRDPQAHIELGPRYNVAPTQPVAVVVQRDEGRFIELHRWGLVPAWSDKPATRAAMINARAETVAASPAFRTSFRRRRCMVPADGFYEWRRDGRARQPFLIRPRTAGLMAFAGVWAPWRDPQTGEWQLSCAVITTQANDTVGELHDRMPAILGPDEWAIWLDPQLTDSAFLERLLRPADDGLLGLLQVSPRVNSALSEGPDLVEPYRSPETATLFG
jgi:putative SOS response-associated peptidase YedK